MTYEEDREFQRVVTEGLVPKLEDSEFCVSLAPPEGKIDAKFCVELGAMIMLDKPILAVVEPGRSIPPKLALVADKVVHADIATEAGQAVLMDAINDLAKQDKEESA